MPKKRTIINGEPIQRPQRNMKVKKVFDPSDNYLPKKRNKYSICKPEQFLESSNIKKIKRNKKKNRKTKTKNSLINNSDSSPDEKISTIVHSPSPSSSPVIPTEIPQEGTNICLVCNEIGDTNDIIDCPICLVKVHEKCLMVNEPIWKYKLELCPWICESCRESNCSKCLKGDMDMLNCITCKVGVDYNCYESSDSKPLEMIKDLDVFVCAPCLTLASDRLSDEEEGWHEVEKVGIEEEEEVKEENKDQEEEEEKEEAEIEKDDEYKTEVEEEESEELDFVYISSDEMHQDNDNDTIHSNKSYNSSLDYEKEFTEIPNVDIPNVTKWNKYQVYEYLADCLPKEVLGKIIKNEIDGRAMQLLKRSDITLNMGLKLGHAMKFYKQVRILQTQSTYHKSYWE